MAITVGVRFRNNGKVYDFDPGEMTLLPGEMVVVETARGVECGEVVRANRQTAVDGKEIKPILRKATVEDRRRVEENAAKEREAVRVCQERIAAHGLEMKLVDAEYAFDNSKILFNFTAEGRVDFRELVKDLAGAFHTRIELHQIGVRDEAKKLGGLGICGRPFCCAQFLRDFQPVSIKMAKEQGLSLNPTKISGSCGRLMCCLKYEQSTYEELWKLCPKVGAVVMTPEGRGVVTESAVLTGKLKVRLDKNPDSPPADMCVEDVNVIRDGRGGKVAKQPAETAQPTEEKADIQPTEAKPDVAQPDTAQEAKPSQGGQGGGRHRSRHRHHRNKQEQEKA
ncbi:MAG: stage 0 sporulation family protein [Clostridia bacterium]|nr:stage 0 sporulation family protein [Clostridia bacterium]